MLDPTLSQPLAAENWILYQDQDLVAVHKHSGFHVHPPELDAYKVKKELIAMYVLKQQIQKKI